jgi:hypothetical protein
MRDEFMAPGISARGIRARGIRARIRDSTGRKRLILGLAATVGLIVTMAAPASAASAPGATPRAAAASTFRLASFINQGKCIGIAGTDAGDYTCTNNPDQTWHWGAPNAAYDYQLINGNGKCLGVAGGVITKGARIGAFNCQGPSHADQYWSFIQSEAVGTYYLFNYKGLTGGGDAWVAGVSGASSGNGAPIILWSQELHYDQYWYPL